MSMFSKIAGASASGGGNPIRDGNYTFLVEKVTLEKKYSGEVFIAELRVIESSPTGDLDERGNQVQPNKPGSTASLVCNLTKHESAAGNAKAFVCGALGGLGYVEEQITEAVMVEACGPTQPLRGMKVEDRTFRGVNKGRANPANAGKPLTLNKWVPVAQTGEDVKAQRAYLDSTNPTSDAPAPAAPAPAAAPMLATPAPVTLAPEPVATIAPAPAPSMLGGILGGR